MIVQVDIEELKQVLLTHHTNKYVSDYNGEYEFDYPVATLQDVELVEHSVMSALVEQLVRRMNINTNTIVNKLEREKSDIHREYANIAKENKKLKEENNLYKDNYGEFISFEILLHELYNGGKIRDGSLLVQKGKWKHAYLKTPKYQKGVNYWLNLFEEWSIFKSFTRGKIARVSYGNAVAIAREKIIENILKKENHEI